MTAPNKKEIVSLIKQTTRTDIFPSQNSNKEQHPVSKAVGPPDMAPSFSSNRELNSVIVFIYLFRLVKCTCDTHVFKKPLKNLRIHQL